ncbi:MAG: transglycosylase SLT domain-containing protein [Candidatus Nanoarchaeia archaeon]|nr:transglycosylase SLT domain-containing protein [Candidatus Nanoarchaeia archaeon]
MRNKVGIRNSVLLGILIVVTLVLISNVSAVFTSSNPQIAPGTAATSSFDDSLCQQGHDFIIQVSPAGCTPVIVRSDLLEEQDVQVYCPLAATQINPMIDIKSISGISFSGNYSQYVKSIGFYPAQAALNLQGQQNTYPLMSNAGYVVINLKQISNESAMPDFVAGNLTAKINYDAEKVFGVGNVNYYLPELTDSDWESGYPEYGFWNGKGYLRLENIEDGTATIKVYGPNLNEIETVSLKQGEKSNAFPVSGFGFCSGGAEIKLNAVKNAGTRVKLDVNGELVEAAKGEKFLENNCQVADIQPQGLVRSVRIICSTDAGKKSFDLKIAPQLNLEVNGESRTVSLGDYLYTVSKEHDITIHEGKSVFLGYIGSTSVEPDLEHLFVVLVALPKNQVQNENKLSSAELASIASWVQHNKMEWNSGMSGILNVLKDAGKIVIGGLESVARFVISGEGYAVLTYNPSAGSDILGFQLDAEGSVKIIGFAEGQDVTLNSQVKNYYESATGDYNSVLENYASEKYPSDSKTNLGEQALYDKILLANQLQQKFTLPVLCDEFKEKYPDSKLDNDKKICKDVSLLSSPSASAQYVSINGHSYMIGLKGVYSPTYDDYGAKITARFKNGSQETFFMTQDQIVIINGTDFMQLKDLTKTTATVTGNVKAFTSNKAVLTAGEPAVFGDYALTLDEVNLKQFAQVSVIPKMSTIGSSADFSFNIGIEKRLIQLNPEKAKGRLDALNKSISKWESILGTTGKIIDGLETACRITGEFLNAKSIVENLLGGQAGVRQIVMQKIWNGKCTDMVSRGDYISTDQCFLQNSDSINNDVKEYAEFRKQQNEEIKSLEKPFTTSSFLGGSVVNTSGFMGDYLTSVQSSLEGMDSIQNPENPGESISISEAKRLLEYSNWKNNNFNVADTRDIELYASILNSDANESLKSLAAQELYLTLTDIKVNSDKEILQETLGADTGLGDGNAMIGTFQKKNDVDIANPITFGSTKYSAMNAYLGIPASNYAFAFKESNTGILYLITFGQDGVVTGTYSIMDNGLLMEYKDAQGNSVKNPFNFFFKQYSEGSYKNAYKDPKVHYFETEPYKGMPAIVPVDIDEGWYAGLKQTLGTGNNIQTYDASARVNSFYLCNVGRNGIQEFTSGIGDDICQSMDLGSGSTYNTFPGIKDEAKVISLVSRAKNAITDAARAYQSGVSRVIIDGRPLQVGAPAADIPNIQCFDFMSPKECNILFNLCDPVICPSSRCDFGGAYPVKDVQATGIIGSVLLCLPNAREGIAVPVCLSGIQTGAENLISFQKAYAACLQEKLDTGKTTGICDEMNSIYLCSLFWEHASPLANLAAPKIAEFLLNQKSSRGGGEYLSVQNAFDTAKQSSDYLTNYYGAGSASAFKLSTVNIGSAFCQNFASLTVPSGAEILNQLSTPDSPPQYTGTFEEISLTTATVPPTSQYKVFYHIYAGKNDGVYYSVYLQRTAGSSFYQDSSSTLSIGSGYIAAGGYADETIDKSASSGYDKLCINVNGQVECGFKQVSTSFAVNYLQDQYLSTELNKTDISKESDCKSGSANIYSLLNPNLQNAVSDVISPELYNQGITRTCATDNPGIGTDAYAESENSRWVEVGYCDDRNIKCWLDTKGIKEILNSPDLAAYFSNGTTTTLGETALDSVKDNYFSILMEAGYLSDETFISKIKGINSEDDSNKKLSLISEIIDKVFYNNQKAYLLLLRGGAYGKLAGTLNDAESVKNLSAASGTVSGGAPLPYEDYTECVTHLSDTICRQMGYTPSGGTPATGTGGETTPGETTSGGGTATPGETTAAEEEVTQEFRNCMNNLQGTVGAGQTCSAEAASGQTGTAAVNINNNTIWAAMRYAKMTSVVNRKCNCGDDCQLYANSIVSAGDKYGIDPLLILSVMMQESECNIFATSGPSSEVITAYGLMQIYSWDMCTDELDFTSASSLIGIGSHDKNIQCGALILKSKYDLYSSGQKYPNNQEECQKFSTTYTGWDAALRGYIGYGCTNNPDIDVISYVDEVNSRYNALKSYMAGAEVPAEEAYAVTISEEEKSADFISQTIEYRDGRPLWNNLFYKYFNGKWYWSQDALKWEDTKSLPARGDENREFITSLRDVETYSDGLNLLFKRIDAEGAQRLIKPSLRTDSADMGYSKEFSYSYKKDMTSKSINLRFLHNVWEWSVPGTNNWFVGVQSGGVLYSEPASLLESLEDKNFFDGARIILGQSYPLYNGEQNAKDLCGYCINAFSPKGAYCSREECEFRLGNEAIAKFSKGCKFVPLEGDSGTVLGGDCIDVAEAEFSPSMEEPFVGEEPVVIERPTAEDKEKAKGVCGYCSNTFSLDDGGCTFDECETKLGQEATEKFFMKCRFTPTSGTGGICTAVTEGDYVLYSGKTYKIDRVGFNISGQIIYDRDVVRRGAVELVTESADNCQWMEYLVWKEGALAGFGDLKVAEDNDLDIINAVLSETTTKGKYHVDVLCFDPEGKSVKITSKNLEVDANSLVTEEIPNVDRIGFEIDGGQAIFNTDVIRTGAVELAVESVNNCVPARYEIWKEGAVFGLGDLKVTTDTDVDVINTVLSETITKGKYHVDVFCYNGIHITSKNLEVR